MFKVVHEHVVVLKKPTTQSGLVLGVILQVMIYTSQVENLNFTWSGWKSNQQPQVKY